MSLLEELYNGKVSPVENIIPKNTDYRRIADEVGTERKYFSTRLSPEDKERFEKWNSLIYQYEEMTEYANFSYGFRMGAMLVLEIFVEKNDE